MKGVVTPILLLRYYYYIYIYCILPLMGKVDWVSGV